MESCRLTIRAQPGARNDAVDGKVGEVIRVRLKAPAVEGKANRALLIFLAAKIGRRSRDLRLLTGEKSRLKTIEIQGMSLEVARSLLLDGSS